MPLPHLHGGSDRNLRRPRQAGQEGRPRPQTQVCGQNRDSPGDPGADRPGLRDRALLLLDFAGPFRRAACARIEVGHLEAAEHGLCITLPFSKSDRESKGVQVGIPYGASDLCPVRAAALARRRRHHCGAAVPPHLHDAAAEAPATRLGPQPTCSATLRSIPASSRASSRHAARRPGSTPLRSAATASSATP